MRKGSRLRGIHEKREMENRSRRGGEERARAEGKRSKKERNHGSVHFR